MLVTNLTAHCFVLSAGVVIRPNAVDVLVSDDTYAADSTLNSQLDALDAGGEVTITGKPTDSFPPPVQSDVDGQVVLTASGSDKTPLTLAQAVGQGSAVLVVKDSDGVPRFQVVADGALVQKAANGDSLFSVDLYGQMEANGLFLDLPPHGSNPNLYIAASTGQTANLIEAYDEDGNRIVQIDALSDVVVESFGEGNAAVQVLHEGATLGVLSTGTLYLAGDADHIGQVYVKAGASQSANLLEAYDENGVIKLALSPLGQLTLRAIADPTALLVLANSDGDAVIQFDSNGQLSIGGLDPTATPLKVYAATSQSANLLEAYDEDSALVFTIHSDGLIETNDAGLSVNHNGGIDAGYLILQPSNAAYDILSVQGRSGQTGKLVQVKDGSGATVFRIDADGSVHIKTGGTIHADL